MFLLVVVNCIFLLAALHVLHSKHEFENAANDQSENCITDRLNNVQPITLPAETQNSLVKSSGSFILKVSITL